MNLENNYWTLHACLPFVELNREQGITLGPVHFWPSSEFKRFTPQSLRPSFEKYIESMREIKAYILEEKKKLISTVKLPLNVMTCVSFNPAIKKENFDSLLIDAIYLLYFATTFRNVYYAHEVPKFEVFTKFLPANEAFIKDSHNWSRLHISETKREEVACIHWLENDICQALGHALQIAYDHEKADDPQKDFAIRLVRSIRYFVDSFLKKFENLLEKELTLPSSLFQAEDLLFLGSSFDALLLLDPKQSPSDFRQKLRPMLHLKFSKPLELFWKWVEGFYALKAQLASGHTNIDHLFRANSNFEASYSYIGMKLFVYTVYYKLFKYKFIPSKELDLFTPPDFKWIHPEELLLFFWEEETILKKIAMLFVQLDFEKKQEENLVDLQFLSKMYVNLFQKLLRKDEPIRIMPTSKEQLEPHIQAILNYSVNHDAYLDPHFIPYLKERLWI